MIQWVTSGYLLALTLVLPLNGWLVARIGARAVDLCYFSAFHAFIGPVRSRLVSRFPDRVPGAARHLRRFVGADDADDGRAAESMWPVS